MLSSIFTNSRQQDTDLDSGETLGLDPVLVPYPHKFVLCLKITIN